MTLSALLQRLTILGFTLVSSTPAPAHAFTCDATVWTPRDACPPSEAFPPPMAVTSDVGIRVVANALLRTGTGRISPPARLSPPLLLPLSATLSGSEPRSALKPQRCRSFRNPSSASAVFTHAGSSPAALPPRRPVTLGSYLPACPRASRLFSIFGSVARPPFPAAAPVAPLGLGSSVWFPAGRLHPEG